MSQNFAYKLGKEAKYIVANNNYMERHLRKSINIAVREFSISAYWLLHFKRRADCMRSTLMVQILSWQISGSQRKWMRSFLIVLEKISNETPGLIICISSGTSKLQTLRSMDPSQQRYRVWATANHTINYIERRSFA